MSKLVWNPPVKRYEIGVDRGVFYPAYNAGPGVPWNGLISITETIVGGEHEPFHFDGIKYIDWVANKDFQATIRAFSAPAEFSVCVGNKALRRGFYFTRQVREPFGLSYRTKIGEDGYKIHMVYNATVTPSAKTWQSRGDRPEPSISEWTMDAVPSFQHQGTTYKPTSHLVVDSTKSSPAALADLEDLLYGTSTTDPELPPASELLSIFGGL